jgi:hypothetical protein
MTCLICLTAQTGARRNLVAAAAVKREWLLRSERSNKAWRRRCAQQHAGDFKRRRRRRRQAGWRARGRLRQAAAALLASRPAAWQEIATNTGVVAASRGRRLESARLCARVRRRSGRAQGQRPRDRARWEACPPPPGWPARAGPVRAATRQPQRRPGKGSGSGLAGFLRLRVRACGALQPVAASPAGSPLGGTRSELGGKSYGAA